MTDLKHKPVLLNEVLDAFNLEKKAHLQKQAQIIDATVGYGGHAKRIVAKGAFVLGIDADWEALKSAREQLKEACPTPEETQRCFTLVHDNFRSIDQIARNNKLEKVDGILIDLGVSSPQLTSLSRGFSFQNSDAPLDMRMDPENQGVAAYDLVNSLSGKQLTDLFLPYMGYRKAHHLALSIVNNRTRKTIKTVGDLLNLLPPKMPGKHTHPATLPFMALRIAVNTELATLEETLPKAISLLKKGGKMVVISFHSGEDSIVKHFFLRQAKENVLKIINREAITPTEIEIEINPRARSAKMRVAEKL